MHSRLRMGVPMSLKSVVKRPLGRNRITHDLRKIEALTLPDNRDFPNIRAASDAVEGMMSVFSMAVMETIMAEMKSRGIDPVLARTAMGKDYKAVYLREREPSDEACFYGERIYAGELAGIH